MRLFRRRNDEANEPAEGPAPGASAGAASSHSDEADVARPEREPTGDWMLLPPVTPTASASMPTTFRVQTLPEILTSHQDSRLSGSLGHAVSADAPSGAVHGLTSSVAAVSPTVGHGELTLREPHHEHHEPAPASLVVHRLASSEPAPLSNAAVNQTHLPPPVVSRTLVNPAPAPSTPADGAPLPVMRVVDAGATSSSAPAATPAPPSADPAASEPSAAPLGEDFRVGGFEVPLENLTGGDDAGPPITSAPPELAPPIQPRRVQRRVDPSAPVVRVSRSADEAGPASEPEPEAPTAPLVGETPVARTADPAAARTVADVTPSGGQPESSVSRSADLTLRAPAPAAPGADAIAPPIQRLAEGPPSPSPPAAATPGAATPVPSEASDEPTSTAGVAEPEIVAPAAATADAPLIGDTDLTAGGAPDLPTAAPAGHDDTPAGYDAPASELPLVEPAAARAPEAATDDAPAPVTSTAPTVGEREPIVPVQTLGDSSVGTTTTAPSGGSSALPLANTDLQPGLQAPTPRPGTDDGPSITAQRRLDAAGPTTSPMVRSGAAPATSDRPLANPAAATAAVQRQAGGASVAPTSGSSGPMLGAAATAPAAATAAPSPSLGSGLGTASAAPSDPIVQRTLVRPVSSMATAPTVGVQRSHDTGAVMPLSTLGGTPSTAVADPAPAVLRRLADPSDALATDGGTASVATPATLAAPVQRSASSTASPAITTASTAAAPSAGSAPSPMPLHTPAASIPSAADVAVKAGLAERAPDGSLLYTSPPAGAEEPVETSFTVQRVEDEAAGGEVEVQREGFQTARPSGGAQRASFSSGQQRDGLAGGGESKDAVNDAKEMAENARKLYPYIRNALEADMRRQLEGRSRSSRFRP